MDFATGFFFAVTCIAVGIALVRAVTKISDWLRNVNIAMQRIGWSVEDYKELRQRIDALDERIDALEPKEEEAHD